MSNSAPYCWRFLHSRERSLPSRFPTEGWSVRLTRLGGADRVALYAADLLQIVRLLLTRKRRRPRVSKRDTARATNVTIYGRRYRRRIAG